MMRRFLTVLVVSLACVPGAPVCAEPVALPLPLRLDGALHVTGLQVSVESTAVDADFERWSAGPLDAADKALVRAVRALRAGQIDRANEVLDLRGAPASAEDVFQTLALGYRGFPDLRVVARAQVGVYTLYALDYRGERKSSRAVRALVVTPRGRVRAVTDGDGALALVQWGWRGWHRAGRPALSPVSGPQILVEPGLPTQLSATPSWRGRFPLDDEGAAPTAAIEALRRALIAFEAGDDQGFAAHLTAPSQRALQAALAADRAAFDPFRLVARRGAVAELEIPLGPSGWLVLFSRGTAARRTAQWQYVARTPKGPRLANFGVQESFELIARRTGLLDRLREPPK
jgi:hypothetical protein